MHKSKNISVSTDANLANSHCEKCQLALINKRCEDLRALDKVGIGGLLEPLGMAQHIEIKSFLHVQMETLAEHVLKKHQLDLLENRRHLGKVRDKSLFNYKEGFRASTLCLHRYLHYK